MKYPNSTFERAKDIKDARKKVCQVWSDDQLDKFKNVGIRVDFSKHYIERMYQYKRFPVYESALIQNILTKELLESGQIQQFVLECQKEEAVIRIETNHSYSVMAFRVEEDQIVAKLITCYGKQRADHGVVDAKFVFQNQQYISY